MVLFILFFLDRARFHDTTAPIADRTILGDATESGLLRMAAQKLPDFDALGDRYPKVLEIPFNSETKWHLTIHMKKSSKGALTLYMKGAPERILKICSTILIDGVARPLGESEQAEFLSTYEWMAGKGHRVLAFAKLELDGSEFPEDFAFTKEPVNFPTVRIRMKASVPSFSIFFFFFPFNLLLTFPSPLFQFV